MKLLRFFFIASASSVTNSNSIVDVGGSGTIVCGWSTKGHETFPSPHEAHVQNNSILHCEACGKCSNPLDIQIYETYKNTLTGMTTKCAAIALVSISASTNCMIKNIGFTMDCNQCWMDNIVCDLKYCKTICLKEKILLKLGIKPKKNQNGLSPCLQCDEDRCGSAFKSCAGANRRRCGIKTDIDRPTEQLCTVVDHLPIPEYSL